MNFFLRFVLAFVVATSAMLFAAEDGTIEIQMPADTVAVQNKPGRRHVVDGGIPLPRETSYQERGFGVGIGGGALFPSGVHCKTLALWQGTGEYYYARYLSAGFSARMYGGNVDTTYAMIYQRYHTHLRLHYLAAPRWVFYLGPTLGFENTDLNRIRNGDDNGNSNRLVTAEEEAAAVGCKNEYILDGFSGGLAMGTGFAFANDWAVNTGVGLEYNTANVGQLTVALGLGFNLRNHVDVLKNGFLGGWILLEGFAHRYISGDSGAWGFSFLLAVVLNI